MSRMSHIAIVLTLLALVGAACGGGTNDLADEPTTMPATTVTTAAPTTLASMPGGVLVHGDPDGRFSLPLVGDWTPVVSDDSYGHFKLTNPDLEMYVVMVDSVDRDVVAETALTRIGLDPAELAPPETLGLQRWTVLLYTTGAGRGVGVAARQLGDATIAVILSGELRVIAAPPRDVFLTLDGFSQLPLAEYLAFQAPPPPRTIEAMEDLGDIEFYSGRTPLVGKLVMPEGEGPFPAILCVHGSGPADRGECNDVIPALRAAGLAVFSYDKRGVGQSEGIFVGVTHIDGDPSPSEWRLPQLADDALAAVMFLQNLEEIQPDQIGLIGASQAGSIIPLVADQSDVPSFAVVGAGQTVSVGEVHFYQQFTGKVRRLPPMTEVERDELSARQATFDGDAGFDPRPHIRAMGIPVLWMWGDLDGWIPPRKSKLELESVVAEHDQDFTILYDSDFGHEWPKSWTTEAVDWILAYLDAVP